MPKKARPAIRHLPVSDDDFLAAAMDPRVNAAFPMGGLTTVPKDWVVPARTMVEHLFYLVTSHSFEGGIAGKPVRAEAGTFIWITPGTPHEFWIPRGQAPFTVHFFRARVAKDSSREFTTRTGSIVLHDALALLPPMAALTSELRSDAPFAKSRLRAALALICSQAFRLHAAPETQNAGLSAAQRRHLTEFQRDRVKARPTPADLARELRLSHDYFSRVFRRSFGMTPKEWLMRERIRHAAQWLASSVQNISEVAYEYGYPNVYLFSRQFKQVMGVGPKAWRGQSKP